MYRRTNIKIMPAREFDSGVKPYLSDDDYLTLQETFTEAEAQGIYPHPESELAAPYAQEANVYEATEYSWQLGIDIALPDLPWWQWNLDLPKFDLPQFPPWTWPTLPPFLSPQFPPWAWPSLPPINWDFTWPDLPTWQPSLPGWTWPDLPTWDIYQPPWTIQWPNFGLTPYTPPGLPSISPWPELGELPDVKSHYTPTHHHHITFFCNDLGCYCPGGETIIEQRCAWPVIDVEPCGALPAGISVRVKGGRICVTAADFAKGSFRVNVVMLATVKSVNGLKRTIGRHHNIGIDQCDASECVSCGMAWDEATSAETIAPESDCVVAITVSEEAPDTCWPFTWKVEGTGFWLASSVTEGLTNTLYSSAGSCGRAKITVTAHGKTDQVVGYVRCTAGHWSGLLGGCYAVNAEADWGSPAVYDQVSPVFRVMFYPHDTSYPVEPTKPSGDYCQPSGIYGLNCAELDGVCHYFDTDTYALMNFQLWMCD